MTFKNLLLGSATSFLAISSAHSADAIVAPEPESAEYVRVCDAYGTGYFYIPGTETCLRIHGYVRYDATGGSDAYYRGSGLSREIDGKSLVFAGKKDRDTWSKEARATLRFSTASETELGSLTTFVETRYSWIDGTEGANGQLRYGYIQLGGLRVGLDESAFVTFPGYLGNVINDDVILAGGYRTNAISYTFTAWNALSAILSLEQGNNVDVDYNGTLKDYTPHVVGGVKFAQGWGAIAAVAAYDARNETWAGKVRADVVVTDQISLWAMGGYKSNEDEYVRADAQGDVMIGDGSGKYRGIRTINSFYGTWGGDWAVWAGGAYKANDRTIFNIQGAYEDAGTIAATANVAYEMVQGFTVTPEVSYTKWTDNRSVLKGESAWQGTVRFQRSF